MLKVNVRKEILFILVLLFLIIVGISAFSYLTTQGIRQNVNDIKNTITDQSKDTIDLTLNAQLLSSSVYRYQSHSSTSQEIKKSIEYVEGSLANIDSLIADIGNKDIQALLDDLKNNLSELKNNAGRVSTYYNPETDVISTSLMRTEADKIGTNAANINYMITQSFLPKFDQVSGNVDNLSRITLMVGLIGALIAMAGSFKMYSRVSRSIKSIMENARSVENKVEKVTSTIEDVENAARGSTEGLNQAAENVRVLSESIEQISQAITDVANSMTSISRINDELSASSERVLTTVGNSQDQMNSQIDTLSQEGSKILSLIDILNTSIKDTKEKSSTLTELENRIDDVRGILTVIEEIADQTNLLSLNAAIEAARAGEAGRGFAVVADEIRKLAARSSESVGEIGHIINDIILFANNTTESIQKSVGDSEEACREVNVVRDLFQKIVEVFNDIKEAFNEISLVAQENSKSSINTQHETEQVVAASEEVSAQVEEILSSSEEVNSILKKVLDSNDITMKKLNEQINNIKEQIDGINMIFETLRSF
ncbi:MAG: methyl-accepting chemotaxis protein [Thermoanaerobacteraceae bacterium]|nr:methyl-accepting chemotaxis protein [Thermoanaerobacteraceae bacterium]